nr:uncharacterized mitochondrial protein AtMg00810-like [Tanacetum cinerariifolium]
MILNTLDPLGKFDGKADEGYFVGYYVNSKAFRVFNSKTKIVEETMHITFHENKPNVAGSRPTWLFDIDTLTKFMNYKPVVAGNQSNGSAGKEEKKNAKDPGNEDYEVLSTKEPRVNQKKDANVNITNTIYIVSPYANAASIKDNAVDKDTVYGCANDLNMSNLEKINYSDDDEDVGAEADMTNLDSNIPVSPIPTTSNHKEHPVEQIIGDIHSAPQTKMVTKNVTNYVYQMNVKTTFLYGKIEEEVYVCQPLGFEDLETASDTIDDGIFINQDKYVDEILKKFGFSTVKTTSTPMETSKPLLKDENAEDVDVHLYRTMIGSLMYLTSSRPDIMFVVCACARFQVTPKVSHLHTVKRIFRYLKGQPKLGLWYPKDSLFDLEAYTN